MFNAGRILRNLNRRESVAPRGAFLGVSKSKKKTKKKFRCYIPFVWQAMVATSIGLIVIVIGAGLCVIGYYADRVRTSSSSSSRRLVNATSGWLEEEAREINSGFNHWRSLIYVGPALMSCGSFAIVFSCVVVCEMRDKMLEIMDEREGAGLSPLVQNLKLDFYQSVVYPQHNKFRPQMMNKPVANQITPSAEATQEVRVPVGGSSDDCRGTKELRQQQEMCTGWGTEFRRKFRGDVPRISVGTHENTGFCSANSIDGLESCPSRTKRVRYSSEPMSAQGRPKASSGKTPPKVEITSAPTKRIQSRCLPEENVPAKVVSPGGGQQQQRLSDRRTTKVRRLLVTRKPGIGSREAANYQTSSIEVLFNASDVPDLFSLYEWKTSGRVVTASQTSRDADRSTCASLPPETTPCQREGGGGSGTTCTSLPPNVLVHQAYVHADPEKGLPVTMLLPPNTQFSQLTPEVATSPASSVASLSDRKLFPPPFVTLSSVTHRRLSSAGESGTGGGFQLRPMQSSAPQPLKTGGLRSQNGDNKTSHAHSIHTNTCSQTR